MLFNRSKRKKSFNSNQRYSAEKLTLCHILSYMASFRMIEVYWQCPYHHNETILSCLASCRNMQGKADFCISVKYQWSHQRLLREEFELCSTIPFSVPPTTRPINSYRPIGGASNTQTSSFSSPCSEALWSLLPVPLWPGVVVFVRVPLMGQIYLF